MHFLISFWLNNDNADNHKNLMMTPVKFFCACEQSNDLRFLPIGTTSLALKHKAVFFFKNFLNEQARTKKLS